jgi:polyisoprenoid-binding protein YceI
MKRSKKIFQALVIILAFSSLFLTQCKKDTETVYVHDTTYVDPNDTGIFVPGTADVDTSWVFDKVHANVNWQSKYYDFSSTMLTGRFNNFNFNPKFNFDETNLSSMQCDFWVQLSTYNTGEPGRDGYGKCGLNYLGITYLDSAKTQIDPLSDTAKFHATSITIDPHDGYILHGTFTFNRYRPASGHADGDPITKDIDVKFSFNGMRDFDSNNDGTYDKLRSGFTARFTFNRSDFMDENSTKVYFPVPTVADSINNVTAVNNKTYGVWSTSVGDEMEITVNAVFYKNH